MNPSPESKYTSWMFYRTCQECGHKQSDKEPVYGEPLPEKYDFRKCQICKSESLDYGSWQLTNPKEIEDRKKELKRQAEKYFREHPDER